MRGGLQICDLKFHNLALGSKLLWNLIGNSNSWSSQVLRRKYLLGSRLRCLDNVLIVSKDSSIFNLCQKVLPLFRHDLTWIPGNDKKIRIWKDSIMENSPLASTPGIWNFWTWMETQGLETLWAISSWNIEPPFNWENWNISNFPVYLT